VIDQRDIEQQNNESNGHGAFQAKRDGRSLVALIARQVQLNNLQLCRSVKYRPAARVNFFQAITAIVAARNLQRKSNEL
jgi:hypothetical protein